MFIALRCTVKKYCFFGVSIHAKPIHICHYDIALNRLAHINRVVSFCHFKKFLIVKVVRIVCVITRLRAG